MREMVVCPQENTAPLHSRPERLAQLLLRRNCSKPKLPVIVTAHLTGNDRIAGLWIKRQVRGSNVGRKLNSPDAPAFHLPRPGEPPKNSELSLNNSLLPVDVQCPSSQLPMGETCGHTLKWNRLSVKGVSVHKRCQASPRRDNVYECECVCMSMSVSVHV